MTNHSHYAPEFELQINNQPVPTTLRHAISAINYQSALEGADRVEITVINSDLRWLDHPLMTLDNKVTLSLGYAPGRLTQVFLGEIVSLSPSFPSSGVPTLTIAAQDRIRHLQQGNKTRWFAISTGSGNTFIPDPFVADLISLENGFIPVIDPVGLALSVLVLGVKAVIAIDDDGAQQRMIRKQDGMSDYEFLTRIAKENGWEMVINHEGPMAGYELHFMSPLDRMATDVTLRYGQSLIEFQPRLTNVGQIIGVSVRLWISAIKLEFTVSLSFDWDRLSFNLSITPGYALPATSGATPQSLQHQSGELAQQAQQAETVGNTDRAEALDEQSQNLARQSRRDQEKLGHDQSEVNATLLGQPVTIESAPRIIMSKLLPKLNTRLTGSGSTIGDPRIRAGAVLDLQNMGTQFSGPYRVTSATHTLDSGGYRTSFEVRKEIWFGSVPSSGAELSFSLQGQQIGDR